MTVDLPPDLTGRPTSGFGWSSSPTSCGTTGCRGLPPDSLTGCSCPNDPFTSLPGEIRFGFSDERLTGALTVTREAPGARWKLRGYREMALGRAVRPAAQAWATR